MKYIFHIGTNEGLSVGEIGSVLGYEAIIGVYKNYMLVDTDLELNQLFLNRLGSVISIFKVSDLKVNSLDDFGLATINSYFDDKKFASKVNFAISSNCLLANSIEQLLKNVKKNLKSLEVSCRFIENVTAAAFKEAGSFGIDLFSLGLFKFGAMSEEVYFAEMICIQDIDAYSARDYSKPYRSAKLGMLPPKLAQIMINLAAKSKSFSGKLVYDPFCGTGTVLMESLLMGHSAQGSDIQEVNIVGTNANIEWLAAESGVNAANVSRVFELDATKISSADLKDVDCIVTEGFLGVPKQGNEPSSALVKELEELGDLYFDFLKAVSKAFKELESGLLTVVLTLPVYKGNGDDAKKNFFIENLVEKLAELGYSVSALVPDNSFGQKYKESVLYKRNDQKVFRQVYRLTLTSK